LTIRAITARVCPHKRSYESRSLAFPQSVSRQTGGHYEKPSPQRFVRVISLPSLHLLFTAPDGFAIWDDLAAKEPRTFISLPHADERIEALGKNNYIIRNHNARLRATVAAPEDAQVRIEPNIVTAAGQPGSVDKGERQERGLRLAISTGAPATSARLVMLLKIEDEE
jgi:hypothetical protein